MGGPEVPDISWGCLVPYGGILWILKIIKKTICFCCALNVWRSMGRWRGKTSPRFEEDRRVWRLGGRTSTRPEAMLASAYSFCVSLYVLISACPWTSVFAPCPWLLRVANQVLNGYDHAMLHDSLILYFRIQAAESACSDLCCRETRHFHIDR